MLRILILLLTDVVIVAVTPILSLYIRLEGEIDPVFWANLMTALPVIMMIRIVTFHFFGLYNRLWRYASINEVVSITGAVTVSSVLIFAYLYVTGLALPRSINLLGWFFCILFVGASRFIVRIIHHVRVKNESSVDKTRVLLIGAGDAGAIIAREIQQRYFGEKLLVGFIDDDASKRHKMMYGVKILGNRQDISRVVQENKINEIIIAMPSIRGTVMREIIKACKETGCEVKILPGLYELIDGQVTVQQLRNVQIEDLLGRDPVQLDYDQIAGYLRDKRVLVTGAGGSIGSELCRQIAKMSPKQLLLLGKGENSIYNIDLELRQSFGHIDIVPVIADIRDKDRINDIFGQYRPQVVFHAAAHKHVPLMEEQPGEAVKNNIFGTKTVAEAADRHHTEIFIMISTDKAVNPTSVMGATKRTAELIIQYMNSVSKTKYTAVRFGNVLGSRGSVVPLFKKQIAAGGPITITHPDMVRYFMTIPEATQLVLQAGAMANGGEVFILDMGEPVKIIDMATDLIKLSGLKPHEDIKLQFTGLRPGEKLFEELLTAEEGTTATKHTKIFVANLPLVEQESLQLGLLRLQHAQQPHEIIHELENMLPTYRVAREKYGHSA